MAADGISDGTDVTVREGEVDFTSCNCCGKPTTVVTGYLDVGALSAGWYTIGVTLDAPNHLPLCRLYIGDWTESAHVDERWGIRIGFSSDGPQVLDWPDQEREEARPLFTPLNKGQVLGTPLEPQLWSLLETIQKEDSRL